MLHVAPLARARGSRTSPSATAAHFWLAAAGEKGMKEIGKRIFVAEEIPHFFGRGRSCPGRHFLPPPLLTGSKPPAPAPPRCCACSYIFQFDPELVVFLALLGIADHFVCFVDFLEARLRRFVARVDVRMVFAGHLPKGLLD